MTKDDIIRMAEEARLVIDGNNSGQDDLLYFAVLVAAAEREACAAMFDELLEALKDATEGLEIASAGGGVDFYAYAKTARAAIAKAEGEMK